LAGVTSTPTSVKVRGRAGRQELAGLGRV